VRRYHKGKTNLDFTEARDSEWQWHQLGCMPVCTSRQHPTTLFLQTGCSSCRPTNSVKALKAQVPEGSTLMFEDTKISLQYSVRSVTRNSDAENQLDSFSRFDTTLTSSHKSDRHTTTANTALAEHHGKNSITNYTT